jgi:hypothetical protein
MHSNLRILPLFAAALLVVTLAVPPVQAQSRGGTSRPAPAPTFSMPDAMREPAHPQGLPGTSGNESLSITSGCCQAPGPDGLHCCDTRDCGWFSCGDMAIPSKTYR